MGEAVLQMRSVNKSYGDVRAVWGLDLDVLAGEIVCLVGPSGCGKTTTLRLIAGFERPDSGTIDLLGRPVDGGRRSGVGLVFQDGALFPHLDVAGNVGFGLNRLPGPQRARKVGSLLEMVGLAGMDSRRPHELSGGEQQRVALARALAPSPQLLLLDEPLSHLHPHLAGRLGDEMLEIIRSSGAAAVWVTHNQQEGLSVADRVALMEGGMLRQFGSPAELWARPADAWVAEFLGYGDLVPGVVSAGVVRTALGEVSAGDMPEAAPVGVLVRPDDISFSDQGAAATVVRRYFSGTEELYYLRLQDGVRVRCRRPADVELIKGGEVKVALVKSSLPVFPA